MLHVTQRTTEVRHHDVMNPYHVVYETFAFKWVFGFELQKLTALVYERISI